MAPPCLAGDRNRAAELEHMAFRRASRALVIDRAHEQAATDLYHKRAAVEAAEYDKHLDPVVLAALRKDNMLPMRPEHEQLKDLIETVMILNGKAKAMDVHLASGNYVWLVHLSYLRETVGVFAHLDSNDMPMQTPTTWEPLLRSYVVQLPEFHPLVFEVALLYWYLRRTHVQTPITMAIGEAHPDSPAPILPPASSSLEQLVVVFETAMLARYLEDTTLASIMSRKFNELCKKQVTDPNKSDDFINIAQRIYSSDQDGRPNIQVFRQLVAVNAISLLSVDAVFTSVKFWVMAKDYAALKSDIKRMEAARNEMLQ